MNEVGSRDNSSYVSKSFRQPCESKIMGGLYNSSQGLDDVWGFNNHFNMLES